ncbi:MAG: hypothetical protein WB765_13195 [Acidimicrobiales bacterium]|jgi:hypothetical protein
MYAVVTTVDLSTSTEDPETGLQSLRGEIVPAVKAMPGFVAGYWLEGGVGDGNPLAVVLFESEEAARHATESMGVKPGPMPNGATFETVDFREVIAHG